MNLTTAIKIFCTKTDFRTAISSLSLFQTLQTFNVFIHLLLAIKPKPCI